MRIITFVLALLLLGCAPKKHNTAWSITAETHCARNGEKMVCVCENPKEKLNAKTGQTVIFCD